jgi:hypothetical protein
MYGLEPAIPDVRHAAVVLHAYLLIKRGNFRVCIFLLIDTLAAGRMEVAPYTPTSADPHHRVLPSPAPAYASNRAGGGRQSSESQGGCPLPGLRGSVALVQAPVVQHR